VLAHGANAKLVGTDQSDAKDVDGKAFVQEASRWRKNSRASGRPTSSRTRSPTRSRTSRPIASGTRTPLSAPASTSSSFASNRPSVGPAVLLRGLMPDGPDVGGDGGEIVLG
jgi:hypothetical protein